MEIAKRIYLSRLAEKIDKNKDYAERIGTKNKSRFIEEKKNNNGGTRA